MCEKDVTFDEGVVLIMCPISMEAHPLVHTYQMLINYMHGHPSCTIEIHLLTTCTHMPHMHPLTHTHTHPLTHTHTHMHPLTHTHTHTHTHVPADTHTHSHTHFRGRGSDSSSLRASPVFSDGWIQFWILSSIPTDHSDVILQLSLPANVSRRQPTTSHTLCVPGTVGQCSSLAYV